MVDQISGSSSLALRPIEPQRLTGSQRSSVQDILADFDAEEVSEADAVAIREKFRAEGIRPSADLRSEIEAAGFDVDDLRPPGGPGGAGGPGGGHHGPPPPPPPKNEGSDALLTLLDILESYEGETLSSSNINDIQQKFQEAGHARRGSFVSLSV
ncbi:MAG: hypothetical protein HOA30_00760 [Rhodospirillaceae bacterium]|nr:hypothetical protein [Rhodospirillaceae bacterium]MBT5299450.1 hypothetical protein [Rhodospirillaceae bacterium]MBT6882581.1 hypothetical protein [Rhodospirillaceae bacterium]